MSKFPGEYGFGDIIKFKLRGYGVVEGEIVGCVVNCVLTDNQYVTYKVHSLKGQEPRFYFKDVDECKIIKD
jgi:hypothetical protein